MGPVPFYNKVNLLLLPLLGNTSFALFLFSNTGNTKERFKAVHKRYGKELQRICPTRCQFCSRNCMCLLEKAFSGFTEDFFLGWFAKPFNPYYLYSVSTTFWGYWSRDLHGACFQTFLWIRGVWSKLLMIIKILYKLCLYLFILALPRLKEGVCWRDTQNCLQGRDVGPSLLIFK